MAPSLIVGEPEIAVDRPRSGPPGVAMPRAAAGRPLVELTRWAVAAALGALLNRDGT